MEPYKTGPEERKLSNRLYFMRHGVWPASVIMERITRAGGQTDLETTELMSEVAEKVVEDVEREMGR